MYINNLCKDFRKINTLIEMYESKQIHIVLKNLY